MGYTDVLKENGYNCGISGKWHMSNSKGFQKNDHWNVHAEGGGSYYGAPMIKNGELINEKNISLMLLQMMGFRLSKNKVRKINHFI